ncbi:tRNA (adenosine(37)-N6)-dimethylallyltransferase MiaA [Tichowtungia aerotolerans]|uniref:tRNA dimethylallyltransferase n=1 Tax=Tichowtungia aerotolerans TaxID=2697043 RepID=A0A6P1M2Q8_9BACT|nr:tRNA (adenosine(37)-N6)-dimethylallyltransferase MiaA [Tichowtungia aerotolerans]QHI68117.1 tRNA (adenosine(37)-N6)-dimethylallyltransferase MiaA [Tichowtungia aerotolerans]
MTADRPSAFVLVGPTASGKSSVAQRLAEQTDAALVSADSMNIYRGMDIGTAKPPAAERGVVPYYGIDLADPTESFSVGDWLNAVKPAFSQCLEKPAMVAGGTGLYVKCLLAGLDDLPAADEKLRARAEKMSLAELQAEAQNAAPEAYQALSDKENPRRLVRLLETVPTLGKKKGADSACWTKELPAVVGLHVERDVLHKRIAERVDQMYAEGLIEEARGLIPLELSSTAQHAIGYAEAFAVLRNEMTEAQAREKTIIRTRQLAKRQMTWFRHQLNVEWVETRTFQTLEKLAEEVFRVWEKDGAVPLLGV